VSDARRRPHGEKSELVATYQKRAKSSAIKALAKFSASESVSISISSWRAQSASRPSCSSAARVRRAIELVELRGYHIASASHLELHLEKNTSQEALPALSAIRCGATAEKWKWM